ncbi:MAG: choice-of-anchor K domain-containing protein [Candidatus Cloacimonetes bacterium]|nr:choice-of-anchor K domain-containing protein [Candidatus Cloacimonadota bacterium]
MKRKHLLIISAVVLLSLLAIGGASAFTVGSVDGIWGTIDTYESVGVKIDVVGVIGDDPGSYWGTGTKTTQAHTLVRNSSVCIGDSDGDENLSEWTGYPNGTYTYLGSHTILPSCTPEDLFISEYVHHQRTGTDRRVIEIFNGTSIPVNMVDYSIHIYNGGATSASTIIPLDSYNLQSGSVFVLANNTFPGVTAQQTNNNLDFTGDDAVALVKGYQPNVRDDAECSRWVTGGINSAMWSDNYWNQTNWPGPTPPAGTFDQDENLVLYGRETYLSGGNWAQVTCANTAIDGQSGFGFDGNDGPISPAAKTPFYLGTFTHYNQPVFAWAYENSSDSNSFESVFLNVTVPVTCNDGSVPAPFTFDAHFFLEETSNTVGECEYGDPGDEPCPDKVSVVQPSELAATFTCPEGDYTVNILGFTSEGLNGQTCDQSFNPASVSTEFITQEFQSNSACLWAEIDQPAADLDANKTCQDIDTQDPFYRVQIVNKGPGSSRQVELTDTLPAGANYDTSRTWVSSLTTSSGTNPQGQCTVVGKTVACRLLTPLPDWTTDPAAVWTVDIPVTWYQDLSKMNTVTVTAATYDPNLANNTATAVCNPTSANFVSFDAQSTTGGILVGWETADEVDSLGFNIYRATEPDGEMVKVNPAMILSKAMGSTSGAVYEFLDENVETGITYYYWLEDVDFALTKTLHGPISVE